MLPSTVPGGIASKFFICVPVAHTAAMPVVHLKMSLQNCCLHLVQVVYLNLHYMTLPQWPGASTCDGEKVAVPRGVASITVLDVSMS
jgi:hypothetical protein